MAGQFELKITLRAGNHQVIGQRQRCASAAARDSGIESCKTNGPGAATSDLSA